MGSLGAWAFTDDNDDYDDDENLIRAVSQIERVDDDDESLALSLQFEEFSQANGGAISSSHSKTSVFSENSDSLAEHDGFVAMSASSSTTLKYNESSSSSMLLSDPQWELIDPTPNIHALFIEFDKRFFWGQLAGVEIGWSKRMTTCAGICYYSGRRSGYCRIGLSEPLLKLRALKELVETLIHEMIHAYLFVTNNNKDHDGHGGEFHKHMHRINKEQGLSISVYHTFHDEVAHYKRHWWRCDGPCRNRPPYHGYVKRASNRAPSKNDLWWADHQRNCGGTYVKVKEPEDYADKRKKKGTDGASSSGSQLSQGSTGKLKNPKQNNSTPGKDIRQLLSGFGANSQGESPSFSQPIPSQIVKPKPKPKPKEQEKPKEKLGKDIRQFGNGNSGGSQISTIFGSSQAPASLLPPTPSSPLSLPPPTVSSFSSLQGPSSNSPSPVKKEPVSAFSGSGSSLRDSSSSSSQSELKKVDVVLNSGAMLRKLMEESRINRAIKANQPVPTSSFADPLAKEPPVVSKISSSQQVSSSSSARHDVVIIDSSDSNSSSSPFTGRESSVACPVCGIHVSEASINLHLDSCLS